MNTEEFRLIREAVPFRPFIIHMADGRAYPVRHRDFIVQGPPGHRVVFLYREDGSSSCIDLLLVNELEIPPLPTPAEPPSPGANGG